MNKQPAPRGAPPLPALRATLPRKGGGEQTCVAAAALLALLLAACVSPHPVGRDPDDSSLARTAEDASSPAVLALLAQAQQHSREGVPNQAVAVLERALRIEPRNPFIWQALAQTHLEQELPEQAEAKAKKSNSLARGNPYLEVTNWRLIAQARELRGDAEGAALAHERADDLEDSLPHAWRYGPQ